MPMRQRGRRSPETLNIIEGGFTKRKRPEPPETLTAAEANIWRTVVQDEPLDFFVTKATQHLLANYCRHQVMVDLLSKWINGFSNEQINKKLSEFEKYLRLRDA